LGCGKLSGSRKGRDTKPPQSRITSNHSNPLLSEAWLSLFICFEIHFLSYMSVADDIRADNVNINEVDLAPLNFLHFELKGEQLTGFGSMIDYSG
jgi:hypothetical protein